MSNDDGKYAGYVAHLNAVAQGIEELMDPPLAMHNPQPRWSKLAWLCSPEYQAVHGNHVEVLAAPLRRLRAAVERALLELGASEPPAGPAPGPALVALSGGKP